MSAQAPFTFNYGFHPACSIDLEVLSAPPTPFFLSKFLLILLQLGILSFLQGSYFILSTSYGDFTTPVSPSPVVYVCMTSLSLTGAIPMDGQCLLPLGIPRASPRAWHENPNPQILHPVGITPFPATLACLSLMAPDPWMGMI